MNNLAKLALAMLCTVWAFALLVILWQFTQNGRYQLKDGQGLLIIDTRTGATYHPNIYKGITEPKSKGIE